MEEGSKYQPSKEEAQKEPEFQFDAVYLGSRTPRSFADVENEHPRDPAFKDFRLKFGRVINTIVVDLLQGEQPNREWIRFSPEDQVRFVFLAFVLIRLIPSLHPFTRYGSAGSYASNTNRP